MGIHFPLWRDPRAPADTPAYEKVLQDTYGAAKRDAPAAPADRAEHRRRVLDLAAQTADRIPLPMGIVHESDQPALAAETIDVAPHDFELARLVDTLNWMTRCALTKGGGSGTKMPERLASRGMSGVHVATIRVLEDLADSKYTRMSGVSIASAMLGAGNGIEHALALCGLAESMDDATLQALDIDLDLSKVQITCVRDWECGHAYVVAHHADSGFLDFSEASTYARAWNADSHQLYPIACRYDRATYNHYPHIDLMPVFAPPPSSAGASDRPPGLDLAVVAQIERSMTETLGPHWADRGFTTPALVDRLRYPAIELAMRRQGVRDPRLIDLAAFAAGDRAKMAKRIDKMTQRILLRVLEQQVQAGQFDENWAGLYPTDNPNVVYRNAETGALLAPSVPVHCLGATEWRRWAWAIYQEPPQPVSPRMHLQASRQPIPPAVRAIEQEPFLRALAAAQAMNFGANSLHAGRTPDFDRALTALEDWIDRMRQSLSSGVQRRIGATGLHPQVIQALERVKRNLDAFAQVAVSLEALSQGTEQRAEAAALRERALQGKGRQHIDEIQCALKPSLLRSFW